MTNPYETLDERAFWSPAVAKRHPLDITTLWQAPFPILPKSQIVTFGSCFAQHFSKALIARGFNWLDAEPAPTGLPADKALQFGYGVFSARTGNIYTTTLLLQWTRWALGVTTPPDLVWEKGGRFYDPFRPTIEPDGFASADEVRASRQATIAAFRKAILTANLLVFTLGLTESWWQKGGAFEYPMCPGTAAGTFDADQHVFVNEDYQQVREALTEAIRLIRAARPKGPRVLLTVSPVPLTATNSGNHVLVATMESKSILRAVAGSVARKLPGVSYFPSYEIINSPAYRGMFFEPNMRSVNKNGVNHVMSCFFAGLGKTEETEAEPKPAVQRKAPAKPAAVPKDDIVCDEELLRAFGEKS